MGKKINRYYKFSTFDKYVLKEFIRPYFGAILLIVFMVHITEIMERLDFFIKNHITFFELVKYYIYKTPFLILEYSPIAILFAVVFSLGMLAKNKEIIAIVSSGISFKRVVLYLYITGFLISLFFIVFNDMVVVDFQAKADAMYKKFKNINSTFDRRNFSMYGKHNFLYNIGYFNYKTKELSQIQIIRTTPQKDGVVFRIDAERAIWDDIKKNWIFYSGIIRYFNNIGDIKKIEKFETKEIKIPEKPIDFAYENKDIDKLNIREALKYINKLKVKGFTYQKELVDFHLKFSFPFMCFIMMLIGAPLSFYSTKSVVIMSIGMALLTGFLITLVMGISISFGKNGVIPPIIAAWVANIIFIIVAVYIHKRIPG